MGERKSVVGWLHCALTILLAVAAGTLGLLVATRKVEIRATGDAHAAPVGAYIRPVAGVAETFALLGHKAHCFEYKGAVIDCWIEVEIDGKKTRLGEGLAISRDALQASDQGAGAGGEPSGHLIWVRRGENDDEKWDLAISISEGGKAKAGATQLGITPPKSGPNRGSGESVSSGGSLVGGQEITLATVLTFRKQGGEVARTAVMKCKAVP